MSDRPRAKRDKQAQLQHRDNKAKRAAGSGQEGGRRGTQRGQQGATLTAIKTIVVCLLLVNFIHYCLYCHFPRAGLPYPALSLSFSLFLLRFVLYFTCCRTKKIQLKRNNIALHHQSSCPAQLLVLLLFQLLFLFRQQQLLHPVCCSSAAACECDAGDKSLSPPTTCKALSERGRGRWRGQR